MKALVKYAVGEDGVELRELEEPVPGPGELKVKVLAAGICGSDMHAILDHPGRKVNMPATLGHEYVGQVVETNGDTGDFKVGDWISTLPACYSCGECEFCKRGLVTLCRERKSIGTHRNGCMANYVVVPARYSFHVPDNAVTIEDKKIYALAEPLACDVRGVYERMDVKPGDVVVVSGPGTMGNLAAQLFKLRGAYVIMSGLPVDAEKLALARKMGIDETVTSLDELKEAVYRKNPNGADITCDATGIGASLKTCMEIVRTHGVHLQIGVYGKPVEVRLDTFFEKEVNYVPSNSSSMSSFALAMQLIGEGKVDLHSLISMEVPLEDWKKGVDEVLGKKSYKVVLIPDNHFD